MIKIKAIFYVVLKNNNRLLTEREAVLGNIGLQSWQYVLPRLRANSRGSTYCHDWGPIFPSTARASSVSKLFILWHSASDSEMHFRRDVLRQKQATKSSKKIH